MYDDKGIDRTAQADAVAGPATFDSLLGRLSHRDRRVRLRAAEALGETGHSRAVEPLIYALSKELSRDAGSYPVIVAIVDALGRMPDARALDALEKVERQFVDRDAPGCPAGLPAGVITYNDPADGRVRRAVPRQLHFKVLDVMQRMSVRLGYRVEAVAVRYQEYEQTVVMAELDRMTPGMAALLQEDGPRDGAGADDWEDALPQTWPLSAEDLAGVDYEAIRRQMEAEVRDYLRDNEKMLALIRDGQRIKAHIRHVRAEMGRFGTGEAGVDGANSP
ncbi:MAG TPA: HEAT repeat domain-containing protein [Methanocella sp.]|nr:HEAT repeat domain-containing protein [Methanocella sp.]